MTINLSDYETGAKYKGDYDAALLALQHRLSKIQVAHILHRRRTVIMLEGWDGAGKGGIIKRMTADWDPRYYQVHPIAAPTRSANAAVPSDSPPVMV
jgi:polyphosphate kinase 2 (PPK2 family)